MRPLVVGIDLAGSPQRNTGFCVFDGRRARVRTLHSDEEIIRCTREVQPLLVAIDAPLALPKGRKLGKRNTTIVGSRKIHFRRCDLELRRMKIRFFPITLGPMRQLTIRGLRIRKTLKKKGLRVEETYPGGAQDLWGVPRNRDRKGLLQGLRRRGIRGLRASHSADELDSVTCAIVAWDYLHGRARAVGDPREGVMILPVTEGDRSGNRRRRSSHRSDMKEPQRTDGFFITEISGGEGGTTPNCGGSCLRKRVG